MFTFFTRFEDKMKHKKEQTQLLRQLEEWLKHNSSALLASALGYKNSSTINQWVIRQSIPRWQVPEVKKIINGGAR
jgi:hypothetical protein